MNTTTLQARVASPDRDHALRVARMLITILGHVQAAIEVRLWDNTRFQVGGPGPVQFSLIVRDPSLLRRMVIGGTKNLALVMAAAHIEGGIDFDGDVYAVLKLRHYLEQFQLPFSKKLALLRDAMWLPRSWILDSDGTRRHLIANGHERSHSRSSDKEAISFHYDVSNEFYSSFLDSKMVYSCGYFEHDDDTLEQAQKNKLDHVCRKLRLRPGERFLDIGCGWGAMVCWAAKHYGVQAHGITLSRAQLEVAERRIAEQGLQDRVTVELRDYRDLMDVGVYDKVSSIGMFEHVGLRNLPEYNATVFRVLKPTGLFLNHGITHDTEGFHTGLNTEFLQRYVFPDGELDTVSNIQRGMEKAGFEILDVEGLRPHYAKTLRHWVSRLERNREAALTHVDEGTFRVWRMYMAGSALEFETGGTGIHQILVGKWRTSERSVPLSRSDLYHYPRPE